MHRGFIKIWRKIEDSGIDADFRLFGFAVWLIKKANWKTKKNLINGKMVEIKRGQTIIGQKALSEKKGLTRQIVRTMIKNLKIMEFLTINPTSMYTIVTICNYDRYQDVENKNNQQPNQRLTNEQPTANQRLTTSKELKKEKNKSEQKFDDSYSTDFEKIWGVYPRRIGKADAYKNYKIALKITTSEKIKKSVDAYARHVKGKDPQYTSHFSTWLNKGRWDDQLETENPEKIKPPAFLGA